MSDYGDLLNKLASTLGGAAFFGTAGYYNPELSQALWDISYSMDNEARIMTATLASLPGAMAGFQAAYMSDPPSADYNTDLENIENEECVEEMLEE